MNMNDLYPSKYLKAEDITQPLLVTISGLAQEEVGQSRDRRPVLYFSELAKGLILNKTVYIEIANHLGQEDTDNWRGGKIQLVRGMTQFQGKPIACIRTRSVTVPPPAPAASPFAAPSGRPPFAPLQSGQPDYTQGQTIPDPGDVRR